MKRASVLVWCAGVLSIMPLSLLNAQVVQWTTQFGGEGPEKGLGIAVGPNALYTVGIVEFGTLPGETAAGKTDAFLSKLDLSGNLIWSRQFGTSGDDAVQAAAADASGVYVVGYTGGALQGASAGDLDVFVRKYDPNGNVLWTRQFGGPFDDEGLAAAVDASGVYVGGFLGNGFVLPGQTGTGGDNAFVRKYDFSGNELWTRQFATGSGDRVQGIATDANFVYVTGKTQGVLGASSLGGFDGFLRKYDPAGNTIWTRQFGTSTTDWANAVAVNSSGVYVSGQTVGTFAGQTFHGGLWDAFAMKFDLNGTQQWVRQIGGNGDDYGYGAALGPQWAYFTGQADNSYYVWRFDYNGTDTGNLQQGTGNTRSWAVATDPSGAYVAGETGGSQLGQVGFGQSDAFVIKVPHPPSLLGASDAFTGQAGTAPTTWTALYGSNLSVATRTWDGAISGTQLPTALDEVRVTINGKPATLYFVSPSQVNVLAPLDTATGNVQLVLSNKYGTSLAIQVNKGNVLPAFYAPFGEASGLRVTAVGLDGAYVGKVGVDPRVTRGAKPGEILQVFATGFGATNPPAPSDSTFLGAPAVVTPPRITIGGTNASFIGTGNLVAPGLYQFNITIPDLADGDYPIIADIGGVRSSATVFLTIKK